MKKSLLVMGVIMFIFYGCYYDKASLVYPSTNINTCDTTGVTYSNTITGILNANCYTCHSGTAAMGGGIKLDTYNGLKVYINNKQFLSSVMQDGSVPAMPLGGSKLSTCDLNKIQAWINHGAPNN